MGREIYINARDDTLHNHPKDSGANLPNHSTANDDTPHNLPKDPGANDDPDENILPKDSGANDDQVVYHILPRWMDGFKQRPCAACRCNVYYKPYVQELDEVGREMFHFTKGSCLNTGCRAFRPHAFAEFAYSVYA